MEQSDKERLYEAIRKYGSIRKACKETGCSRASVHRLAKTDDEFKKELDEAKEVARLEMLDKYMDALHEISGVEPECKQKSLKAIMFYIDRTIKELGRRERDQQLSAMKKEDLTPERIERAEKYKADVQKRIKNLKDYYVQLLKKEGRYTPELAQQAEVTATSVVRLRMLQEEVMFNPYHKAIQIEISREGNTREHISEVENLFKEYLQVSMVQLRALGMNTDSKERKADESGGDSLEEFMAALKEQ
jgi:hypothetical protein